MFSIIDEGLKIEHYSKEEKQALAERFPHLRIDHTEYGLGVFAKITIPDGSYIGRVDGTYVLDGSYGSEYCMACHPYGVMEPSPPLRYVNHSCDPNCQIVWTDTKDADGNPSIGEVWFQALKEIPAGSQLFIDYAWGEASEFIIPCKCGSENCRGWIASEKEARRRNHEEAKTRSKSKPQPRAKSRKTRS